MVRRLLVACALLVSFALSAGCGPSPQEAQEAIGATQTLEVLLRQAIEQTEQARIPTPTLSPSPSPTTTITATPRPRPTKTPVGMRVFDGVRCYRWDSITLDDVGETRCVWGQPVKQKIDKQNGFTWLYFGGRTQDFQFVAYAEQGYYSSWTFGSDVCIFLDGEIHQIGETPVITIQGGNVFICN